MHNRIPFILSEEKHRTKGEIATRMSL